MAPLQRILTAVCVGLLAAGGAGAATHTPPHRHAPSRAATGTSAPPTPAATTTVTGPAGPSGATLAAGLVTPTDMGGYYRVVAANGASLLDSAVCLAALQPSPAQSGRALTALLGPDSHSVPAIVEEVASYPGSSSRSVYNSVAAALGACSSLSFSFDGVPVTSRLAPSNIPPVGDADRVWSGSFTAGGSAFTIQVGLVLDGQMVLALVWIDRDPPSDPVMGSFTSTLSLAIGKLA